MIKGFTPRKIVLFVLIPLFSMILFVQLYQFGNGENNTLLGLLPNEPMTAIGKESLLTNYRISLQPVAKAGCLFVHYESAQQFEGEITIFNIIGRQLQQIQTSFQNGKAKIPIDVSQFSNGDYLIAISNGEKQLTRRFRLFQHKP